MKLRVLFLFVLAIVNINCAAHLESDQLNESVEVLDNFQVIGDMVVSEDMLQTHEGEEPLEPQFQDSEVEVELEETFVPNSVANKKVKTWPKGILPVVFESKISKANKDKFIKICNEILGLKSRVSCRVIKVSKYYKRLGYIYVRMLTNDSNPSCGYSYVGRTGKKQELAVHKNCWDEDSIPHELMHAAGIVHEQNRPDRDNTITVNFANIKENYRHNFHKLKYQHAKTAGSYDLKSVMHYGGYSFSQNGKPTIVIKNTKKPVENSWSMSEGDHEILISIYGKKNRGGYGIRGASSKRMVHRY